MSVRIISKMFCAVERGFIAGGMGAENIESRVIEA
jgi:hypothetical protein